MEKALFVEEIKDLKLWSKKYSRIYFGSEFCQRLIPSLGELKKIIDFCKRKNLAITFVTPFVTDEGLSKLKPLFSALNKNFPAAEVVVNDWGVINFLSRQYPEFGLCLGRLLNKQKRGPRVAKFIKSLPPAAVEYFSLPLGESVFDTDLAKKLNIKRVELDNLLHGIDRNHTDIPASIYYPYLYVSTTRLCLVGLGFHEGGYKRKVNFKCARECRGFIFTLTHPEMPVKIYLKGNTQFVKNTKLPSNMKDLNIDRVVYQKDFLK